MSATTATRIPVASTPLPAGEEHFLKPISRKTPIALSIFTVVSWLLLLAASREQGPLYTVMQVDTYVKYFTIHSLTMPSLPSMVVLGVCQILMSALAWWLAERRIKLRMWFPVLFGLLFIVGFLVFVGAGQQNPILVTNLLTGAMYLSVPLIFGSLAGCVGERVGVVNVAIEGDLLFGAFLSGIIGALVGASAPALGPWIGLLMAPIAGALVGCLLALFAVRYWVDHIIVGVVLNVLVLGLTNYIYDALMQPTAGGDNALAQKLTTAVSLPTLPIPGLSQIPIIGEIFFRANILVYLMYIFVFGLQFLIFRSKWGLRLRACGEHPKAADTVGIKVNRTRIRNAILASAIAGLGGAYYTVASGNSFNRDMTNGAGYIALAAMILGKWNPKGAVAASLLFGFALNAQQQLGIVNMTVPSQFMGMVPFVVTIVAVAGFVGKVRPPAAENKPYVG